MKNTIKTSIILILMLFPVGFSACSSNDPEGVETTVTYDTLPAKAKEFISRYYPDISATSIERVTAGGITLYQVGLENGDTLMFNTEGNWTQVTAPAGQSIPLDILPEQTREYLSLNYSDYGVRSAILTDYGYQLTLESGVILRFDFGGYFIAEGDQA
jgi:hypothetical protein